LLNSSLHREPVFLSNSLHRDYCLKWPVNDFSFASETTAVCVTAAETELLCLEYPIVFVEIGSVGSSEGEIVPAVIFGLSDRDNLFVESLNSCRWRATVHPRVLQLYPFAFANAESSVAKVVIDVNWSGWSTSDGEPLFDHSGAASGILNTILGQLKEFELEMSGTRVLADMLMKQGLLIDMRFEVTSSGGNSVFAEGFKAINFDRFSELDDGEIGTLHRSGALSLIAAHRISLVHMRKLADWYEVRAAQNLFQKDSTFSRCATPEDP